MSNGVNNLYEFGSFRLDGDTGTLWRDNDLVSLSPKALELLTLLIERRGEIVSKQEIFDRIWADTFVEDGVLTQNIYTLRNALGTDENGKQFIENIARRGYRFGVPIRLVEKANGQTAIPPDEKSRARFLTPDSPGADISRPRPPKSQSLPKLAIWLSGTILLLSVFAFFGFRYLTFQPPASMPNVKFQKLTDTGDIFFPTISPDGNFVAYSKLEKAFVKDLRTGAENLVDVPGVKGFGFLQFSPDSNSLCFRDQVAIFVSADVLCSPNQGGKAELRARNVWGNFSFSPDGRLMAFVRAHPNENRQVVTIKDLATGAEKEVMTRNTPQEFYLRAFPAWAADGRRIAVVTQESQSLFKAVVVDIESGREEEVETGTLKGIEQVAWLPGDNALVVSGRHAKNFQLWKIPHPAGEIIPITNDLGSHRFLSLSADRSKLVTMQVVYYSNIFIVNPEDQDDQIQITSGTSKNDGFFGIDWFSDGRIVYTSNEGPGNEWNLWSADPSDRSRRRLTENAGARNDWPAISADDRFIYFSSNRNGHFHIWRLDADGGNPVQITFGENEDHVFPQVSPDSAWLYFIKKQRKFSSVWRRSLADGSEEKITAEDKTTPGNFLSISPDGKFLAFHNITERPAGEAAGHIYQIVVMSTEDPQKLVFTTIERSKLEVYWTPDGKALEYISYTHEGGKIWRLGIEPNAVPKQMAVFPKERLFFLDWSRDGKRLALSRGQQLHDAVLVTNFEGKQEDQ